MALFEIRNGEAIIPDGTRVLPSGAFCDCPHLEKVVIPESVLKIEAHAFYHCKNLKKIFIPCTVSVIEIGAFGYCSSVESIVVDAENPRYDSREGCNAIVITEKNSILFGCSKTIDNTPNSIKRIEREAFVGCNCTHNKMIIPKNIKSIGVGAFCDMQGLAVIIMDASIKTIPERSFAGCASLCQFDFWNDNVKKIDNSAFDGVSLSQCKVPYGKIEHYKALLPERFSNIIVEDILL